MNMMRKLMRNSVAAAGFAALLLVGACAHNDAVDEQASVETDTTVVTSAETTAVDVAGNVDPAPIAPDPVVTEINTATITTPAPAPLVTETETTVTTTETTTTTTPSMASSVQESTTTTTTDDDDDDDEEPSRTRMRKD
jgi:hypothetical protein